MRQKHTDTKSLNEILQPPENLCDSTNDTSVLVSPTKEDIVENCWNCGEEMNPSHQCDEDNNESEKKCYSTDETSNEETDPEKVECVNCQDCHWPEYVFC